MTLVSRTNSLGACRKLAISISKVPFAVREPASIGPTRLTPQSVARADWLYPHLGSPNLSSVGQSGQRYPCLDAPNCWRVARQNRRNRPNRFPDTVTVSARTSARDVITTACVEVLTVNPSACFAGEERDYFGYVRRLPKPSERRSVLEILTEFWITR